MRAQVAAEQPGQMMLVTAEVLQRYVGWQCQIYYPECDIKYQGPVKAVSAPDHGDGCDWIRIDFEWTQASYDGGEWCQAFLEGKLVAFWEGCFGGEKIRVIKRDQNDIFFNVAAEQILIFYPRGACWIQQPQQNLQPDAPMPPKSQ